MAKIITVFLILSFTGLAVFGFLGMGSHEPGHGVNGCIAALMKETGCAGFNSPVDFVIFHLSAYKIFSSINISAATLLSMMLLAFALLLAIPFKFLEPKSFAVLTKEIKLTRYPASYEFHTFSELKFIRWLALHEKRDNVFSI